MTKKKAIAIFDLQIRVIAFINIAKKYCYTSLTKNNELFCYADNNVLRLDLLTKQRTEYTLPVKIAPETLLYLNERTILGANKERSELHLFDNHFRLLKTHSMGFQIIELLAIDANSIAILANDELSIWNISNTHFGRTRRWALPIISDYGFQLTPSSIYLLDKESIACVISNNIYIYNINDTVKLQKLTGCSESLFDLKKLSDNCLFARSTNGSFYIWNIHRNEYKTFEHPFLLPGEKNKIYVLDDGRLITLCNQIQKWKISTPLIIYGFHSLSSTNGNRLSTNQQNDVTVYESTPSYSLR